ncbi:MAG: hypothetical protein KME64_42000 [Scytonematopsis contorta HA4267-MV1]|jgi:hypothetical protein|nr:hypothetical protein [Scytonematopsis contorta HA4267-MV1]
MGNGEWGMGNGGLPITNYQLTIDNNVSLATVIKLILKKDKKNSDYTHSNCHTCILR